MKCNEGGGLEESQSPPGKNPTEELSDPYIDDFLASQQLNHGLTGLLMAITRTDNNNTVVYQVRRSRYSISLALRPRRLLPANRRSATVLVSLLGVFFSPAAAVCYECRRGSARARHSARRRATEVDLLDPRPSPLPAAAPLPAAPRAASAPCALAHALFFSFLSFFLLHFAKHPVAVV